MSVVNLEYLSKFVDVPKAARSLLAKSDKEIKCTLALRLSSDEVVEADCFVVYHNTVRGPAKGGIRMSPDVSMEETRDLAERMTYKSSLVGIPFGGGKSGICIDPARLSRFEKTALLREYCHNLRHELQHAEYIPAPDMGTNPTDMAVIYGRVDRLDVVTGKPPRIGGLPGRTEATGKGVICVCESSAPRLLKKPLSELSVAVQGFGNVGLWSARFAAEKGARIIAVSDVSGAIFNGDGLDIEALAEWVESGHMLDSFPGEHISNEELLTIDVDVLIPAAAGGQINGVLAERIQARMIVEGANGPLTPEADCVLDQRGVHVVPDILANAGGVVASYVEWRSAKSGSITVRSETYDTIADTLHNAFDMMMEARDAWNVSLRTAAQGVALREVVEAMRDRAWI